METISAFAMGIANRDKELMVFDWDKAAKIIKSRNPKHAAAGLSGDWEWAGDTIFIDGKPIPEEEACCYLSSTWATPELEIDGEIIDCFRMQSEVPNWNSGTYWPQSALDILSAE